MNRTFTDMSLRQYVNRLLDSLTVSCHLW